MYMQDIVFYTIWGFVFFVMVWLVFMVAKSGNYETGYRNGYAAGLGSQTNCMVRHIHDTVDEVVNGGISKRWEEKGEGTWIPSEEDKQ